MLLEVRVDLGDVPLPAELVLIAAPPNEAASWNVFVAAFTTKYVTPVVNPVGSVPAVVNRIGSPLLRPCAVQVTTPGEAFVIVTVELVLSAAHSPGKAASSGSASIMM